MSKVLSEVVESKRARRKTNLNLSLYEAKRVIAQALFGRFNFTSKLSAKKKEVIFVWAMLALPLIDFLVWYVYVNFNSILLAFKNIDYAAGGVEYWTFDNFKTIWKMFTENKDGYDFSLYAWNTLKYWMLGTLWGFPHSILLTYVLHKKLKGYKFFRILVKLPSIMCGVVMAGIFQSFISNNGALGYVTKNLLNIERLPRWFQEPEFATPMLLFYAFFTGFAGSYILFSGAIANVSDEMTEAAYMDGVTMWQELWYIDIPMMWPTISMTLVSSVATIFSSSGAILLFTPELKETWTFGYWMFDQIRVHQSYYVPSALGLVFTLVAFPVCRLVKRLVDSIYQDVD